MKICVTGGAGFIASHITDAYVALGHDVVVIDNFSSGKHENVNPKARVIEMDVTDESILEVFKSEKFDVVNHHAAQMDVRRSVTDPKFDAVTNIIGGLNMYEAARETGVKKIIFASTGGAIYGEQDYFPADEKHPQQPYSPYGISKLANEKYLFYYKQIHGMEYVALRYTNVYGPRQNPHGEAGVVAIFAGKMIEGGQPIINGDGLQTRDYVYVGDVVRANVLALGDNAQGIYNVCTTVESTVVDLFRILKDATGSDCEEKHAEAKAGEQMRSVCSFKKIESELGWTPQVVLKDGLERTVEFFKEKHAHRATA
ncbi:MAG TPA: NAD-dependent epimerase/dehydratase family protein [Patescibacteria group bacterium]|nr:NAD-dependent epimerase/dehydratase family protein [Patescibacteria group bacterium]